MKLLKEEYCSIYPCILLKLNLNLREKHIDCAAEQPQDYFQGRCAWRDY